MTKLQIFSTNSSFPLIQKAQSVRTHSSGRRRPWFWTECLSLCCLQVLWCHFWAVSYLHPESESTLLLNLACIYGVLTWLVTDWAHIYVWLKRLVFNLIKLKSGHPTQLHANLPQCFWQCRADGGLKCFFVKLKSNRGSVWPPICVR